MTSQTTGASEFIITPEMLNRCHTEPIHKPGAIQDHALLLACDPQGVIIQVSANSQAWLDIPPERLVGRSLAMLLPRAVVALMALPVVDEAGHPELLDLGEHTLADDSIIRPLWWGVRRARVMILEVEQVDPRPEAMQPLADEPILTVGDDKQAAQSAIAQLAPDIGYDRVLAYAFFPGGEGEVIAEAVAPDLEPFLGLRYPASDVPEQVRALALRTPLRVLADATRNPVALVPDLPVGCADQLDLGLGMVRSQSPMYRQYLRNMDIRGTMSASVVVGGRLWGLLICNHRDARRPGLAERNRLKAVAAALGRRLAFMEQQLDETLEARCLALIAPLAKHPGELTQWMDGLTRQAEELLRLVHASGFAVVTPERILTLRNAPVPAAIRTALTTSGPTIIHDGSNRALAVALHSALGGTGGLCGMLAVPVGRDTGISLCWFRPEHNHEITWAGDMSELGKSITRRPDGVPVFSPRRSFAAWTQQVRGLSRPWTRRDRRSANVLAELLGNVLQCGPPVTRPHFKPFDTPTISTSPETRA